MRKRGCGGVGAEEKEVGLGWGFCKLPKFGEFIALSCKLPEVDYEALFL